MAPYGGPSYSGRNRSSKDGGPSGVQRNTATQLKEHEPLFNTYEHLSGLPRGDAALTLLRKMASTVKPIMRKRGWRVQILAEFLPPEGNLLGLNINRGYKICVRLRYHNNPDLFLPLEQIIDTMLHELSHNKWGEHDHKFHALWDELRDEHETLVRKGYTGEGFMSEGKRLGGGRPPTERDLRELAREGAEKRRTMSTLSAGSGRRLGGSDIMLGRDAREVIAGQALLRNTINQGCGSNRSDAGSLAQSSLTPAFRTKAEEDDANDRAITQALYELMEEEETAKLNGTLASAPPTGGLAWSRDHGLYDPKTEQPRVPTEEEQLKWAMAESARASKDSPVPMASGALPPESLISPIKPLITSSRSPRSTTSQSSRASAPPPTVLSPVSPLYGSSRYANSATGNPHAQSTTAPSPVSPLFNERNTPPPKRKATSVAPLMQPPPQPRPSERAAPSSAAVTTTLSSPITAIDISEPFNPDQWTCSICTCINPTRYLACDACGIERPEPVSRRRSVMNLAAPYQPRSSASSVRHSSSGVPPSARYGSNGLPVSASNPRKREHHSSASSSFSYSSNRPREKETVGWGCSRCGAFMEHKWWTCSACGTLKPSS
jgi:hypothetical protein